jgi:hypothetical protein
MTAYVLILLYFAPFAMGLAAVLFVVAGHAPDVPYHPNRCPNCQRITLRQMHDPVTRQLTSRKSCSWCTYRDPS